jgi:formate/nitrite transporter FocA (FNT family)
MAEAGEASPHLDRREQRQAAAAAPMGPLVIHEIVRAQGEEELERSFSGLAWSGFAAGASIAFSFIVQSTLQGALPDAPWSHLVSGFGYCIGFLIVILGRQQLFTETTLTALIPALTRRNLRTLALTLRVWVIVLTANLAATWMIAAMLAWADMFPPAVSAMQALSVHTMEYSFWHTALTGGAAGWLIGLMVWLLPGAGPSRPLIIILLTYVVSACQFPHIIAGSVEAAYGVLSGHAPFVSGYVLSFLLPTLLGNSVGGSILAALLNHAPVAGELTEA